MSPTIPYTLALLGIAGVALIGFYRNDGLLLAMAVGIAVIAVSALAWEARAQD